MKQQKSNYKLDKKTGHLLEVPSRKQVREHVKKIREQQTQEPQDPITLHETQADKNFKKVQKVLDRMHAKAKLPDFLTMARKKFLSTVCVINRPGKQRSLLPDKKGRYVMLCHRKMAKVFTADVCLLVKRQSPGSLTRPKSSPMAQSAQWSVGRMAPGASFLAG